MKVGRQRVEELGKRLEKVRSEIDRWERRESEWQSRVSRRLRIFWTIAGSALLVLVLALVLQNWPHAPLEQVPPVTEIVHQSSLEAHASETQGPVLGGRDRESAAGASWYPLSLEDRRQSLKQAASETRTGSETASTQPDPLRVLDEL